MIEQEGSLVEMTSHTKLWALSAGALALSLALAGCGGGSSGGPVAATSPPVVAESTTAKILLAAAEAVMKVEEAVAKIEDPDATPDEIAEAETALQEARNALAALPDNLVGDQKDRIDDLVGRLNAAATNLRHERNVVAGFAAAVRETGVAEEAADDVTSEDKDDPGFLKIATDNSKKLSALSVQGESWDAEVNAANVLTAERGIDSAHMTAHDGGGRRQDGGRRRKQCAARPPAEDGSPRRTQCRDRGRASCGRRNR